MRERVDRGLEPLGAVLERVLDILTITYTKPGITMKRRQREKERKWWAARGYKPRKRA